jgi:hypothetical protein
LLTNSRLPGTVNLHPPPADIIIAGNSPNEMQAIPIPNTSAGGGTKHAGCNTFLPAQWLVDVVLASPANDPFEQIILARTAAEAFNAAHDNDPLYLLSAKDHLCEFAIWAWGVRKGKANKTTYRLGLNDSSLEVYRKSRHADCIAPITNIPPIGQSLTIPPDPIPVFPPGSPTNTNNSVLHQLAAQRGQAT